MWRASKYTSADLELLEADDTLLSHILAVVAPWSGVQRSGKPTEEDMKLANKLYDLHTERKLPLPKGFRLTALVMLFLHRDYKNVGTIFQSAKLTYDGILPANSSPESIHQVLMEIAALSARAMMRDSLTNRGGSVS